jgi:hypothetical protein
MTKYQSKNQTRELKDVFRAAKELQTALSQSGKAHSGSTKLKVQVADDEPGQTPADTIAKLTFDFESANPDHAFDLSEFLTDHGCNCRSAEASSEGDHRFICECPE